MAASYPPIRAAIRDTSDHLSVLGLPPHSVANLVEAGGRTRRRSSGHQMVLPLHRSSFLLVDGQVAEMGTDGRVRLWRDAMIFDGISKILPLGDVHQEESRRPGTSTGVLRCMSRCYFIELPNQRSLGLVMSDPLVGALFLRLGAKRYALTERLYAATRATPVARVAALLDYLAKPRRRHVVRTRESDGQLVMTVEEDLVASGPSQAEIADALCLGRATVEKAVSELRRLGALKAFGPGERTNRTYPIADRERLSLIALGG